MTERAHIEPKAFDMGRFQRVVGYESDRITGTFHVLQSVRGREGGSAWVKPVDMVIWHDGRNWGSTYSSDFPAFTVKDGAAQINLNRVPKNRRDEIEEVWEELLLAYSMIAEAARYQEEVED